MSAVSIGALGVHDVGGDVAKTETLPLRDDVEHFAYWEGQVHAIAGLLQGRGLLSLDEMRRAVEGLPEAQYNGGLSYYQKWAAALLTICLERGTLTQADLDEHMGPPMESCQEVRFSAGQQVRVGSENLATRWRRPHLRTPGYIFGAVGTVERFVGVFPSAELGAYCHVKGVQPLYRVRFQMSDLWPEYAGSSRDTVDVEIYQNWLELDSSDTSANTDNQECKRQKQQQQSAAATIFKGLQFVKSEPVSITVQGNSERRSLEQAAIEAEEPVPSHVSALIKSLLSKGVLTETEISEATSAIESWGTRHQGPRIVARAWTDPNFHSLLLKDARAACEELGVFPAFVPPFTWAKTQLTVVQNSDAVHNLIVCTLCSCYPLPLLGRSPSWYRSRSYRSRAVREPRKVLQEFGMIVPEGVEVRVHDSTADCRYLVLPQRPKGTEGWNEEQLISLVTRDCLIGTALPKSHISSKA